MKRTILLFFAIAGILSCTDKDTIPKNQVDPIVGEWKLQSIVYNQTGTNLASECQMKSTYKFNEDGSITGTVYTEDIGEIVSRNKSIQLGNILTTQIMTTLLIIV